MCYTLQVPSGYHVITLRDDIAPYIMLHCSTMCGCAYFVCAILYTAWLSWDTNPIGKANGKPYLLEAASLEVIRRGRLIGHREITSKEYLFGYQKSWEY